MEAVLAQYLALLLDGGLTRYEIIPFFVVLSLLTYVHYLRNTK